MSAIEQGRVLLETKACPLQRLKRQDRIEQKRLKRQGRILYQPLPRHGNELWHSLLQFGEGI